MFSLAAVDYMKANPVLPVNVASFEENCGIGVNITPEQIEDCVSNQIHSEDLNFILIICF